MPNKPVRLVRIKNAHTDSYMTVDRNNQWIHCKRGEALTFAQVGTNKRCVFSRIDGEHSGFLSYNDSTGAVRVYDSPDDASFELRPVRGYKNTFRIFNLEHKEYMHLDPSSKGPYITEDGKESEFNEWVIEKVA